MSLTLEQVQTIRRWGEATQYVQEVRLFGSQVSGNATDESDIDLAITIGGDDMGTVRSIYFARGQLWQEELTCGGSTVSSLICGEV